MKKKLGLVVGVLIGCVGAAQAAVITSAADGSWETGTTWTGGTAPGVAGDTATVDHNVTLQSAVTIGTVQARGVLTLNNGATLTANTGNSTLGNNGTTSSMIINSGAKFDTAAKIMTIGWKTATASMVVNGGTFTNTAMVNLGFTSTSAANAYTTLVVTNGGNFYSAGALKFNAITNSITQVSVYKDSFLTAANLDFFGSVVNATNSLTVAGGTLTLIVGQESLALDNDTLLYFDSGTIVITGVNSQNDFNTFTNTWNTWVDDENITSTKGYTKDQLKAALTYDAINTDAVAVIPEPATLGLFVVAGAGCLLLRRMSR